MVLKIAFREYCQKEAAKTGVMVGMQIQLILMNLHRKTTTSMYILKLVRQHKMVVVK